MTEYREMAENLRNRIETWEFLYGHLKKPCPIKPVQGYVKTFIKTYVQTFLKRNGLKKTGKKTIEKLFLEVIAIKNEEKNLETRTLH